ncbi:DnaB-like helicase C-terminal domain-containing protein [Pseudovibrio sp. POLY-S9]|uniref:DnaB-like helicase C-terminal domain-containing protein n=1 Tax=Pseudovibrio sp. POLY-S9 TaxID=1576596 RepID=UPI00070EF559|nr:DnaB-like helicase C-terminal domain-containing protein [Pseudovibrio sp. POLY-S9]
MNDQVSISNEETNILALMLAKPATYFEVADILTGEHFQTAQSRDVWLGLVGSAREGLPYDQAGNTLFDASQVYRHAGRVSEDANVDLMSRIISLIAMGLDINADVMSLAQPIIDRKDSSDAQKALSSALAALQRGDDVKATIGATSEALKLIEGKSELARIRVIGEVANEVFAKAQEGPEKRGPGISTGISDVDRILGGDWAPGDLVGIGGAPASGKTAFLLQVGLGVAERGGVTQFESLEMRDFQLAQRLLAARSDVNPANLKRSDVDADELERLFLNAQKLQGVPFWIDCESYTTVEQIHTRAMARKQRDGLNLLIVDSLKATGVRDRQLNANLGARAGYVMKELKEIAKDLSIPVAVLLHPKTGLQLGPTERIKMEDFYGGSNLQSDADTVGIIHRPGPQVERARPEDETKEDFLEWEKMHMNWPHTRAQFWAEKVRAGASAGGMVEIHFDGARQQF